MNTLAFLVTLALWCIGMGAVGFILSRLIDAAHDNRITRLRAKYERTKETDE